MPPNPAFATPEFVLAWCFGWALLIIVIWQLRLRRHDRRHELIHKERMTAMEKGLPAPEWPDYDSPRDTNGSLWTQIKLNPRWPLGVGAIFVMLGAGTTLALRYSGEDYHQRIWSFGLIPVFFGVGLFLHYVLTRKA